MSKAKSARNNQPRDSVRINVGGDANGATFIAGDRVTINPSQHTVFGNMTDGRETNSPIAQTAPSPVETSTYAVLRGHFSLEDVESICWELGIKFDDLPAKSLSGKARQLVERASALGVLDKLIAILRRERPNAPFAA